MGKAVKVTGDKQVISVLKRLVPLAATITNEQVETAALKIEREAATRVPVDTGRLKGSIESTRTGDKIFEVSAGGLTIQGKEVDYAAYVEYGTKRMAAQPYMQPAADEVQKEYPDILISGIAQACKQAGVR